MREKERERERHSVKKTRERQTQRGRERNRYRQWTDQRGRAWRTGKVREALCFRDDLTSKNTLTVLSVQTFLFFQIKESWIIRGLNKLKSYLKINPWNIWKLRPRNQRFAIERQYGGAGLVLAIENLFNFWLAPFYRIHFKCTFIVYKRLFGCFAFNW